MRNTRILLLAAAMAGLSACSSDLPTEVNGAIVDATASLPNIPAVLVSGTSLEKVVSDGPYPGFDTYTYPGDGHMKAWMDSGKYHWVGFYLPAPCHTDTSWSGKRDTLDNMGWGTAVIYVGQQTWGRKPKPSSRLGSASDCSANLLTSARGKMDALDAVAKTSTEGFARGSSIFLDIEHMNTIPSAMRNYYVAWTNAVIADGRYRPAFYVHTSNASQIHADIAPIFTSHALGDPQFWIAGGNNFSTDKAPSDVGHDFAAVWQGALDIVEKHNSVRLPIDVNVASVPSPSSGEFAQGD
jgi:hypothetical protein